MSNIPATRIEDGYHRHILHPGDIIDTWCSVHGRLSPHVWQPDRKDILTCIICHPEDAPKEEG